MKKDEKVVIMTNELYISFDVNKLKRMLKDERIKYITKCITSTLGKKELPERYGSIIEEISKQFEKKSK